MDMVDSAKIRNFNDDKIKDGIRMVFSPVDLNSALSYAKEFKQHIDTNEYIHKHKIESFCVGDNLQYKGFLESFLKSTSTNDIQREISFLEFALTLMKERASYKNDIHNKFYNKVKDVMPLIEEVLK